MTKKNVAALMLAGAMMTVGSGAMAATPTEENDMETGKSITIPVGASITETVKISVSWGWGTDQTGEEPSFAFTWDAIGHKWECKTAEATLKFKAKNEGSGNKTVSITKDIANVPAWLTVGENSEGKIIEKTADGAMAEYADLCSYSVAANAAGITDSARPEGSTKNLTFTIAID